MGQDSGPRQFLMQFTAELIADMTTCQKTQPDDMDIYRLVN